MTGTSRGPVLRELDRLFRHGTLCGLGDDELLAAVPRSEGRHRLRGARGSAWTDGFGDLPEDASRPARRGGRLSGHVSGAGPEGVTIRERGLLSSWLYGVAYRVANRARTQAIQRHVREIGVDRLEAHASSGMPAELADIGPVLDQELNRLPAKYREPIVLCYLEGRTHDQAAEQLRCPVGTVRSRMARGRDLLKRRLTAPGICPDCGDPGRRSVAAVAPRHRVSSARHYLLPRFARRLAAPRYEALGRGSRGANLDSNPGSAHDYEAQSTSMDRTGDFRYQFVGWGCDRGRFREGSNCRNCNRYRTVGEEIGRTGRGCASTDPHCWSAINIRNV